jgi:hypothetical protein
VLERTPARASGIIDTKPPVSIGVETGGQAFISIDGCAFISFSQRNRPFERVATTPALDDDPTNAVVFMLEAETQK